jgi:large subunit ribosomal protein L22
MRLVIDLIRGKNAFEALNILRFTTKHAADDAYRVLNSAISNLKNKAKDQDIAINDEDIFVKACYSDEGPIMRRMMTAPQGRAYRIRKRFNHLTIVVAVPEEEAASDLTNNEDAQA